jgi:hypothetical protein
MSGKPLGISCVLDENRLPRMFVTPIDRVSDQIWDAVREAINANMTPDQFKHEASEAWQHHLAEDAKDAAKEFRK